MIMLKRVEPETETETAIFLSIFSVLVDCNLQIFLNIVNLNFYFYKVMNTSVMPPPLHIV